MDSIIDIVISVLPGLAGWISQVQVIISALPTLQGFTDSVKIVVSALPSYGGPGIAGALILFLFIFGGEHFLNEEDD